MPDAKRPSDRRPALPGAQPQPDGHSANLSEQRSAPAVSWSMPGVTVRGRVRRLPESGKPFGNSMFLEADSALVRVPATEKEGCTVLERTLAEAGVRPGDVVTVTYHGMRAIADGDRAYRDFTVEVSR